MTEKFEDKLRFEIDASIVTTKINPHLIMRSRWANRHEQSYSDKEFSKLKIEIKGTGGNVQPIKVRPVTGPDGKFEIVFGHRRHQACLELGVPVLAMIEDMSAQTLFVQMDQENRERKDLRPYEQGMMYAQALDAGLFQSARKLSYATGADLTNLGKALSLARLPRQVLDAFLSPLDLQYRWTTELVKAITKDPDRVLSVAKEIIAETPRPDSKKVFTRLTNKGSSTVLPPQKSTFKLKGDRGESGSFNVDESLKTFSVNLANIAPANARALGKIVEDFLRTAK